MGMTKLDRSKCPPEYTVACSGPGRFEAALRCSYRDGMEGAYADAWAHRDSVVADTVARVVAALRKDAGELSASKGVYARVDGLQAEALEEFADALERGEVEL